MNVNIPGPKKVVLFLKLSVHLLKGGMQFEHFTCLTCSESCFKLPSSTIDLGLQKFFWKMDTI